MMMLGGRLDTVINFIRSLEGDVNIEKKVLSFAQRLGMLLLSNRLDDAILFALSRAGCKGKSPIEIIVVADVKEILNCKRDSDLDRIGWSVLVWFIFQRVLPNIGAGKINGKDKMAILRKMLDLLREDFKYGVILYLESLVRFLRAILVDENDETASS